MIICSCNVISDKQRNIVRGRSVRSMPAWVAGRAAAVPIEDVSGASAGITPEGMTQRRSKSVRQLTPWRASFRPGLHDQGRRRHADDATMPGDRDPTAAQDQPPSGSVPATDAGPRWCVSRKDKAFAASVAIKRAEPLT
jgi:hypothetical protein